MAYNLTRQSNELLAKHEDSPASLSFQLHPDHWTLNSGSKFLYNSPAAAIFEDIRAHRIPVDLLELFDAAKVPFYEGCMIVELHDHRVQKPKEKRIVDDSKQRLDITRVLLWPNSESLWADLCLLNQKTGSKWVDQDALEVEARILIATAPPLCLDPDPHLGRVANSMFRVSAPRTPAPLRRKRKAAALDTSEIDDRAQARRAKIMQFMDPKRNRSATPSYRLLDAIIRSKTATSQHPDTSAASTVPAPLQPVSQTGSQPATEAVPPPPRTTATPAAPSTPVVSDTKTLKGGKKIGDTPTNGTTGTTGTPTPVPTPVVATPQLPPQPQPPTQPHVQPQIQPQQPRQIPTPAPRPPTRSPHPIYNATSAEPRIAPSPAQQHLQQQHRPPTASPRPPPQPIAQPQLQPQMTQRAPYAQQHAQAYPASMSQTTFMATNAAHFKGKPAQKAGIPQQPIQPGQFAMYHAYMQQQQQHAQHAARQQAYAVAQAQAQNAGQMPPVSRSPMIPQQANGAQPGASPMIASQSRSPMPNTQQQQQQQHSQAPRFQGVTAAQAQAYAMQQLQAQQQQHLQQQQQGGEQQQMMPQYQPGYNFAVGGQVPIPMGRMPQAYPHMWQYSRTLVNGQQQQQQQHAGVPTGQQVPMAKAPQGNAPGR